MSETNRQTDKKNPNKTVHDEPREKFITRLWPSRCHSLSVFPSLSQEVNVIWCSACSLCSFQLNIKHISLIWDIVQEDRRRICTDRLLGTHTHTHKGLNCKLTNNKNPICLLRCWPRGPDSNVIWSTQTTVYSQRCQSPFYTRCISYTTVSLHVVSLCIRLWVTLEWCEWKGTVFPRQRPFRQRFKLMAWAMTSQRNSFNVCMHVCIHMYVKEGERLYLFWQEQLLNVLRVNHTRLMEIYQTKPHTAAFPFLYKSVNNSNLLLRLRQLHECHILVIPCFKLQPPSALPYYLIVFPSTTLAVARTNRCLCLSFHWRCATIKTAV